MKNNFKQQFENLRNIIAANVETLKGLIAQSDNLSKIIEDLDCTEPNSQGLKESLEKIRNQISTSIGELVEHTKNLFQAYDKLLDEAFKK